MRPRTSRWHATVGRPHRPAARWSPLGMPSVIVADQLTKWYGPRLAVDRVSLEVEAGEVMGLLGPNGSGKTTILRILAGYLRPSAGTARIAGLDVVHDSLAARAGLKKIGVVVEPDVVIDPLDHYSTDPEVVAVPVYERHPITRNVALTFFPGIRSLTLLPPPPGVTSGPLFLSSPQSYTRAVQPVAQRQPGRESEVPSPETTDRPGRRTLAAALEGTWPGAAAGFKPFRLVMVGDGDFASNSFLPTWPTATWRWRWCAGPCERSARPRSPCGYRYHPWFSSPVADAADLPRYRGSPAARRDGGGRRRVVETAMTGVVSSRLPRPSSRWVSSRPWSCPAT
jgi:energy-coupling factor transporter ATP-binding protein EcfA2